MGEGWGEGHRPFVLSLSKHPLSLRGAQRRGNLDEAEHTSTNLSCYGGEIANPRIEYGVATTKWVRVSVARCLLPPVGWC